MNKSDGGLPVSNEEVVQMLEALAKLKATNEEAYQQAVQALGLDAISSLMEDAMNENAPPESELKDLKLKPNAKPKPKKEAGKASMDQLTQAIKTLRESQQEGDPNGIKLGNEKQMKGIYISPKAGFAYKTLRVSDQQKVFINITQHEGLDKPSVKKKLDADGNEVEGMNIPMSVGLGRVEKDKKGQECTVYDIVVNPDVISDIEDDATGKFREFICQLGIQSIEQKYKEELDKRYKVPKLDYMGEEIPKQYIQDRKNMPQIEEVSKKPTAKAPVKAKAVAEVMEVEKDLTVTLYWVACDISEDVSEEQTTNSIIAKIRDNELTVDNGLLPYDFPIADYVDPIETPPSDCQHLLLSMELQSYEIKLKDIQISLSPFKLVVKLPGYKKLTCYLAVAIHPNRVKYFIRAVEGFVSRKKLEILLPLDMREWEVSADPGSKSWLLAQALSDDGGDGYSTSTGNPYGNAKAKAAESSESNEFAEDKFHIRLPPNVDQYTGLTMSENSVDPDTWDLPEDRFHQKDAASSFLLEQREQAKKEKWDKYEKEKADRANDPNVEYVDMDDFRPGGKYGPKSDDGEATGKVSGVQVATEVAKASAVLAEMQNPKLGGVLSSNLWTELLD